MVRVRMDLKDPLVQPPCPRQGHLPQDQVAQEPVLPSKHYTEQKLTIKLLCAKHLCFTTHSVTIMFKPR